MSFEMGTPLLAYPKCLFKREKTSLEAGSRSALNTIAA